MKWVTRERPKIDRIACPWLIRRFIQPDAEFLYVPTEQVFAVLIVLAILGVVITQAQDLIDDWLSQWRLS